MKERQENTGRWFIDGDEFIQWKSTIDTFGFFWLRGGSKLLVSILSNQILREFLVGMGKSVLWYERLSQSTLDVFSQRIQSSAIIENLASLCSQDPSMAIAYFYFDFRNPRKLHVIDLLKSLVSQLSDCSTDALCILQSLYSKHQDGRTQPSSDVISDVLQDILRVGKRMFIIVDAVDECVEREELLLWLEKVTASVQPNVRVFCTSRSERELEESLDSLATTIVDFDKNLVDGDIQVYLTNQLRSDKRLSKWQPEVQKEIEDKLIAGAHGMSVSIVLFQYFALTFQRAGSAG